MKKIRFISLVLAVITVFSSSLIVCDNGKTLFGIKAFSASSSTAGKPTATLSSTKSAAKKQTLTVKMKDNKNVVGYYWGKNSDCKKNTYKSVSKAKTVTKKITVSSSGKYYLTVKDSSGYKTTYSVTYYKTTLKPNGGSCGLTYIISKSGDKITFPTPTRSGYTYKGWSKTKSASSGSKAFTVTSSKTYYAIWKKMPVWNTADSYSFTNSSNNFQKTSGECYTVNNSDYTKLKKYINAIYKSSPSYANSVKNSVQALKNETWGGSCYGMSVTALLEKAGKTNLRKNYYGGASTIGAVSSPNSKSNIKSAINYYFLTQAIPSTRSKNKCYLSSDSNWSTGLKNLITDTKNGNFSLFNFFWSGYGHSIVVTGYKGKDSSGNYLLKTYDNNFPKSETYIKISSNYKSCSVSNYGSPYKIEYTHDLSALDYVDIDGPKNDMKPDEKEDKSAIRTTIMMSADSDIKVVNKEGKTLILKNGKVSGTMKIYSTDDIIISNKKNGTKLTFSVDNSSSFTFTSPKKVIKASVLTKTHFNSVNVSNADKVVFSNGKVKVYGKNPNFDIIIPVNNVLCDMIKITGVATSDISVDFEKEKIDLSGIDKQKAKIIIYLANGTTKTVKYSDVEKLFSK